MFSTVTFQGYPPIPPRGFFPSPVVSSPQGHPYMWGPQVGFYILLLFYGFVSYSLSIILLQKAEV
jgi:hypothetical protein